MTTLDATRPNEVPKEPVDNYLTYTRGFLSWALTLDHKRIGVMYMVGVLGAFFVGGVMALIVRTELWTPGPGPLLTGTLENPRMYAALYNQFFTLHGAIMVFLVIIPSIPAALGNFILPIMLGAKDVAFPRMNLGSFYLWVIGAICAVVSLTMGGFDTGWTFYTPYSTTARDGIAGVIPVVVGVFILGFSSIFTGLNFVVTIHKLRPPGMTWFKMPLFLWAIYATALIQILATPVLGITLLMLIVERVFHVGFFDPSMGGDPVLFQHFFWFYSHPAVYIMILPGMGIISEIISVHAHRHIFGYRFIAFSSIAIAVFSFMVWGHHMFTSGQSPLMNTLFSAITFSVAIPSAIKVFNWLATLYKGSINLNTSMLYGLGFLFLFTFGGLPDLHLGTLNTDVHLHDTYFVVAHFHYVMMGSALIAMIGGLHHWWPKMFGRMFSEFWGRIAFTMVFIGFNVTFFTQFMLGSHGMPRRYFTYEFEPGFQIYHQISTVGSYLMGAGFLLTAAYLVHSLVAGKKAPANPWGGRSLEWQCTSPPPHDNFKETPSVGDCYDFSIVKWSDEEQGYYVDRGTAKKSETDSSDPPKSESS